MLLPPSAETPAITRWEPRLLGVGGSYILCKQPLSDSKERVLATRIGALGRVKERATTEQKSPAELLTSASSEDTKSFIRRVKRATRRKYTPEEKMRIVWEGLGHQPFGLPG